MRKKFEVVSGGRDTPKRRKFEEGVETYIVTDCILVHETPKAILVRLSKVECMEPVWLPKRLTEINTHTRNKLLHDIEMPEWLAKEKDLYGEV